MGFVPILGLLIACQEPFDVNRHDLGPFRIAAIGVDGGIARAAVWSGEGMSHSSSPILSWSVNGEWVGDGYDVPVPDSGQLSLTARNERGDERFGQVTINVASQELSLVRQSVALGEDLSITARLALEGVPVSDGVSDGDAARLVLQGADGQTVRWMIADGDGTLLELDELAVDVLAEQIVFDGEEVVSREPLDSGVRTVLVLTMDGQGGNAWKWIDIPFGMSGPFLANDEHRIPVELLPKQSTGLLAVTLLVSDDGRVVIEDPVEVVDLLEVDPLPCMPDGVPFSLAWVVEGRCPRPMVDGARVVLEIQ